MAANPTKGVTAAQEARRSGGAALLATQISKCMCFYDMQTHFQYVPHRSPHRVSAGSQARPARCWPGGSRSARRRRGRRPACPACPRSCCEVQCTTARTGRWRLNKRWPGGSTRPRQAGRQPADAVRRSRDRPQGERRRRLKFRRRRGSCASPAACRAVGSGVTAGSGMLVWGTALRRAALWPAER